MRLTLRWLLAYLDGNLEPQEAQEISKKIEESPFATDLMHRIRDLLRRYRLSAPNVTDRSASLDPNTVAEYLDNTMPSEHVPDFEKVCLESDVQLAEVAACHQILTLALGEPVEIDPSTRERVYELPLKTSPDVPMHRAAAGAAPPPLPTHSVGEPLPVSPLLDIDVRQPRHKPTVPDYLRESKRSQQILTIVSACLLICSAIFAILYGLGQFEPGTPIGNTLVALKWIPAPNKARAEKNKTDATGVATTENSQVPKIVVADSTSAAAPVADLAEKKSETVKQGPTKETEEKTPATETTTETIPENTSLADQIAAAKKQAEKEGSGAAHDQKTSEEPDKTGKNAAEEGKDLANPLSKIVDTGKAVPIPPLPEVAEPFGRVASNGQVLLLDLKEEWKPLGSNELAPAACTLIALPYFSPRLMLSNKMELKMVGGAKIESLRRTPDSPLVLKVDYGRLTLTPTGTMSDIDLVFGQRKATLHFSDGESFVALDVRRLHKEGVDPQQEPDLYFVQLYVPSGQVVWEEEGRETPVAAPTRASILGTDPPTTVVAKDFPKWINAEPLSDSETKAAAYISQQLTPDRLARQRLMESLDHRRKEIAKLVVRSLTYLGYFDSLATALNDTTLKNEWPEHITLLRESVARSPETAAAVYSAFEHAYPARAEDLYRMLCGYNNAGLESGDDASLVASLEDEMLAVRVLSFWNLKDIMDGAGYNYQPELAKNRRQQSTQVWKQRQQAGEIRFKNGAK